MAENELLWHLPSVFLLETAGLTIKGPTVAGYERDDHQDRAYYLEVWIEKSTQDDILIPLCQELGVTLVASAGFQSITNAVKLLQRVEERSKPTRIFYISDLDKQGDAMPVAVARQIERWLPEYAPGAEVKLMHLALTSEQAEHYRLPKDEKGRVELDALEARVPGELARLVRRALKPYLEGDVSYFSLETAREEAQEIVSNEWSRLIRPQAQELASIRRQLEDVTGLYRKDVKRLNQRLQRDMAKFREPLRRLQAEVREVSQQFEPELSERPAPAHCDKPEDEWLFDSSREYLEQMDFYKRHQGKG
jgi:hypothetical protein